MGKYLDLSRISDENFMKYRKVFYSKHIYDDFGLTFNFRIFIVFWERLLTIPTKCSQA